MRRMAPTALTFAVLLCSIAAAEAAATIGQSFAGTNLSQLSAINSGYQFIPPDTMGAVGPNQFVEFTNGSYAVYNKSGTLAAPRIGLTSFWTGLGITGLSIGTTGVTDPRVLYDTVSGRWYAAAVDTPTSGANRYLVAVSNSSDPTAGWKGFAVTSNSSGNFADFTMLGIDNDALYVATNNFSGSSYVNTGAMVIPKADLLLPTPTVANAKLISSASTGFSAQPIVNLNSGQGIPHALLSSYNSSLLKLSYISGSTSSPTFSTSPPRTMSVSNNSAPPDAQQPGGPNTIDTSDGRFAGNVILQGSYLWAVNAVSYSGRSALHWYRINPGTITSSPSIAEQGIISDLTHDYYFGSIAVNPQGDVVIGYTRSGSTEVPSAYASVGLFDGTATTFDSPLLLQAGSGNYNVTFGSGTNRWGDFSATTLDPNDPYHFWTIQEIVSGTNNWSMQITEIVVPEPSTMAMLCGLSLMALCVYVCHKRREVLRKSHAVTGADQTAVAVVQG